MAFVRSEDIRAIARDRCDHHAALLAHRDGARVVANAAGQSPATLRNLDEGAGRATRARGKTPGSARGTDRATGRRRLGHPARGHPPGRQSARRTSLRTRPSSTRRRHRRRAGQVTLQPPELNRRPRRLGRQSQGATLPGTAQVRRGDRRRRRCRTRRSPPAGRRPALPGRDPEDVEGEPEITDHSVSLAVPAQTHNGVDDPSGPSRPSEWRNAAFRQAYGEGPG